MALDLNDSSKQVVSTFALYTGLANMRTVAINPTMEQIKALELPAQKEPEYTTDEQQKDENNQPFGEFFKKTRIDIYLGCENPKIKAKLAFWVEDRQRFNQKGDKVQWINLYGVSCWTPIERDVDGTIIKIVKPDEYEKSAKWFKMDGARIAKPGEEMLHEWLKSWANVETGKRCQIETIDAIAQGNLSELQGIVQALQKNEVRYLLGVAGGQYQAVYDKLFGRTYEKSNTRWIKKLQEQYGEFKADYQNSLDLKTFTGNVTTPNAQGGQGTPGSMSGGMAGAGGALVF